MVGLKKVKCAGIENEFHALLKRKFPNNIEDMVMKGKKKVELYKFHMQMMLEFDSVPEDFRDEIVDLSVNEGYKRMMKAIRLQRVSFQTVVDAHGKKSDINDPTISDQYIVDNAKYRHEEHMKHLDIIFVQEQRELEQVRIKRIELENSSNVVVANRDKSATRTIVKKSSR